MKKVWVFILGILGLATGGARKRSRRVLATLWGVGLLSLLTVSATPASAFPPGTSGRGCIAVDMVFHWQKLNGSWATLDTGYHPVFSSASNWFDTYPSVTDYAWWNPAGFNSWYVDYNVEIGNGPNNFTYYGQGHRVGFRLYGVGYIAAGSDYKYFDNFWPGTQHECAWGGSQYPAMTGNNYQVWVGLHRTYISY